VKIVIDATEPLDIREAREDEEGFEIHDDLMAMLRAAERQLQAVEVHVVRMAIKHNPDHPGVPYLREYLKESDHAS